MHAHTTARSIPERLVTGAFIFHAGYGKWRGTPEQATALHGVAANAFPILRAVPPPAFLRLLAAGEMATGAIILAPLVPDRLAGGGLSLFSGTLLTMYWRTPTMRKAGSIWPTPAGTAISKDVWMLGIGASLLID